MTKTFAVSRASFATAFTSPAPSSTAHPSARPGRRNRDGQRAPGQRDGYGASPIIARDEDLEQDKSHNEREHNSEAELRRPVLG